MGRKMAASRINIWQHFFPIIDWYAQPVMEKEKAEVPTSASFFSLARPV
ncbi:MAG: hypothetical protein RLZZ117_2044 [Cyanobacteriota bacterium]|jgi:hypothetical protein